MISVWYLIIAFYADHGSSLKVLQASKEQCVQNVTWIKQTQVGIVLNAFCIPGAVIPGATSNTTTGIPLS